jgi:23S rRNA (cytosine1962-C5)-methyltransferase
VIPGTVPLFLAADWPQYQLLDSGNGRKLERFSSVIVDRGEPKAWWRPDTGPEQWGRAEAVFHDSGRWELRPGTPRAWTMALHGLKLQVRLTDNSKHLGVFPEQFPHWQWMAERLQAARAPDGTEPRVLNLFGYTGVATLVAAHAGARVTHVDASKPSVAWGRDNQTAAGLADAPIRWILDDAVKYVTREARRGSRYEAILLDPPSFGRGPKGEVWKVEQQLVELLGLCRRLLSERPAFLILTLYYLDASCLMLGNLLGDVLNGLGGQIEVGELTLPHAHSAKRLPLSLFGRWAV